MNHELIDRYLYAVTKRMNTKIRSDVEAELRSLIDDMLAERCGENQPTEKDVRVVLTELGTPQELYSKYSDDGGKCLIGQPYYSTYIFVMKIVLAAMAIAMTIASVVDASFDTVITFSRVMAGIGTWFAMMWSGMLQAVGIVTVVFAFLSYKKITLGEPYNLDELPAVPKKKAEISRFDCIFSIGCSVVFVVLLLAAPQYLIGYWGPDGVIPLFDSAVLGKCWYLLLIFAAMDITRSAVRLLEGSYNRKVLTTTVVTNIIGALATILWLTRPGLINPEFVTHVQAVFIDEASFIQSIFVNFQHFLLVVILIAYIMDTAESVIKYLRK